MKKLPKRLVIEVTDEIVAESHRLLNRPNCGLRSRSCPTALATKAKLAALGVEKPVVGTGYSETELLKDDADGLQGVITDFSHSESLKRQILRFDQGDGNFKPGRYVLTRRP